MPAKRKRKDAYSPRPEDHFTWGLWTVGNRGRDPFGEAVRGPISPERIVAKLGELGAYGVNFHDNDLVPMDATPHERDRIVRGFKAALKDAGLRVPMATVNLFYDPVFKDGAFTSTDARVRAFAVQKAMRAMELGREFGAEIFVLWGGREGCEVNASRDPKESVKWYRDAVNYLCRHNKQQRMGYKFALEAKPNEPRGDIFLATTGHMLAFIETLDFPEMVGVNPETAHEVMAGLDFSHGVAQALEAGKLFHIDLNDQKPGRYDQDLRFSSADLKGAFFLVKLLEESGYKGMKHFDSHAYRSEDEEGVWDFALNSMRSYLILKEKAARFGRDKEIQGILREVASRKAGLPSGWSPRHSASGAQALLRHGFDLDMLRTQGYAYERLDQLTNELLWGIR